ncbi:hypothetical protein [Corynebacterium sp. LK2510]|uniref:Rv1157c family protein n=1 Tax=Corynebacterium sp. LK2510 TaxID=3110472 RepID=UPI0034CD75F3
MPQSRHRHRRMLRAAATVATLASLMLGVSAPAASAQSSRYIDTFGRPTPQAVRTVHEFAAQPFVPQPVADTLRTAVNFFGGRGETGGPDLPTNAPVISQFIWPTVSLNCIGPGLHSTASAIAVPGPAEIPAPGVPEHHTGFVFTALGTPPAAEAQGGMNVYWANVTNGRTGVTPLDNNQINPTGPATLSGVADTGPGTVLAVVGGSVRTTSNVCTFAPTVASFNVR